MAKFTGKESKQCIVVDAEVRLLINFNKRSDSFPIILVNFDNDWSGKFLSIS